MVIWIFCSEGGCQWERRRRVLNEKLCFDFAQMRETAVAFIGEEKETKWETERERERRGIKEMIILTHKGR